MDARMMRATYGVTVSTSVAVGRIIAVMSSHGRPPGGICVIEGRVPGKTVVAKITTSQSPITNSGMAANSKVMSELALSKSLSRRSAAYAPIAIASGREMMAEQNTRKAELTMRSSIRSLTGICAAYETPASPCSSPVSQLQYCEKSERSRLSWSRRASRLSGVAWRPRIARAGSPSACVAANTMIETMNSTSTLSRMRRRMKPQIPPNCGISARLGRAAEGGPAGTSSSPLGEGDGAVAMAERVEVQRPLARHEPDHLRAVGVDEVVEERDDVAALVVLELLHLDHELVALGQRGRRHGLLVEGEVRRPGEPPVGLVVGGSLDAAERGLRQVAARAPEVDRERQLEV